jgi:c-di-GMP-binding flagellar brake protein YcgR
MDERRRVFRWKINRQAKLKLEDVECFADCHINDINLKGAQICLGHRFPKDTFLKFCIFLAKNCVLEVEAWIVWHKSISGTNGYGLYFTKLKDEDKEKIYQFVNRFHPQQIKYQYCQDQYQKGGEIMPDNNIEDRRIFERFQVRLPTKYLDLNLNKEGQCQTHDISAKGVGLVTNAGLQPRTAVELWLHCPDEGEPLYTRAEVIWSNQVSPNEYRVGVNLEKANLMGLSRVLRLA